MQDVITIRPAVPEDLAAIDRVLAESYHRLLKADYPPSTIVMAVPIIARANPALLRSGTYYVAEMAGSGIVGAGGLSLSRRSARRADIRHFVTHHNHLRRGIGQRLMTEIFRQARRTGITRLDCLSTRTGVPFYASQGFRGRNEVTMMLGPAVAFPVVQMWVDLNPR